MQKRPRFLTKKRKDRKYCNATIPSVHLEQRKAIQIGAAHRQKATEIAFALNVNPTSVSRESKRNRIPDGDGTAEKRENAYEKEIVAFTLSFNLFQIMVHF